MPGRVSGFVNVKLVIPSLAARVRLLKSPCRLVVPWIGSPVRHFVKGQNPFHGTLGRAYDFCLHFIEIVIRIKQITVYITQSTGVFLSQNARSIF